jgi:hypothetical protein
LKNLPTIPFVIWCYQRSGSTHLTSLLASHPDVACWRELFFAGEGSAKEDYFTRSGASSIISFLDRFFSNNWQALNLIGGPTGRRHPRAIGFKLKYQQVLVRPAIIDYFQSHRRLFKIVHLVRHNLLATVVSSMMLPVVISRFNNVNVMQDTIQHEYTFSIQLDPEKLVSDLESLQHAIAEARGLLAGLNVIEITYEDLIARQTPCVTNILRFLEVDTTPILSSRYRKILPTSPLDVVTNRSEVEAMLKKTRFKMFL